MERARSRGPGAPAALSSLPAVPLPWEPPPPRSAGIPAARTHRRQRGVFSAAVSLKERLSDKVDSAPAGGAGLPRRPLRADRGRGLDGGRRAPAAAVPRVLAELSGRRRRAAASCGAAAQAAHLRAGGAARAGGEGRGRGGVMSGEGRGSVRRREQRAAGRAPVPRYREREAPLGGERGRRGEPLSR